MRTLLTVAICLLILCSARLSPAQQAQPSAEALRFAEQHWGVADDKNWTGVEPGSIRPLISPRVRAVFRDAEVLRAVVRNPRSRIAGRPTYDHCLVLRKGKEPLFIEDDAAAAAAISAEALPVTDAAEALGRVLCFAELRGLVLQMAVPGGADLDRQPLRYKIGQENWAIVMEPAEAGWAVSCTFLADPNIVLCLRYELGVSPQGSLAVRQTDQVFCAGAYE